MGVTSKNVFKKSRYRALLGSANSREKTDLINKTKLHITNEYV